MGQLSLLVALVFLIDATRVHAFLPHVVPRLHSRTGVCVLRSVPQPSEEATDLSVNALLPQPSLCPRQAAEADTPQQLTSSGLQLLVLCFLVTGLCALDRVAMSVAVLPMAEEFGYSESTKGVINSVFSLGYMAALLPAGLLGSFASPKLVMACGAAIWSVAQIAVPAAAHANLLALYMCRFLMGSAEAVAIPTIQTFVARFVPPSQRSLVIAFLLSGLQVGDVAAYTLSPTLISVLGWEGLFYVYGLLGFAWLGLWLPMARDNPLPQKPRDGSDTVVALLRMSQQLSITPSSFQKLMQRIADTLKSVPWSAFIRSPEVWAITGAHMAQNFGLYVLLAWLPTYFSKEFHFDLEASSLASVMPWIFGAVTGTAGGWLADAMIKGGLDRTLVRKVFQTCALLGPAACLVSLAHSDVASAEYAEAIITATIALASLSTAGYSSSVQDIVSKKYVSLLYGATSVPAVVAGSIGVYATGQILDSFHSWDAVFVMVSAAYAAGAVVYGALFKARMVFDD